MTTSRRVAVVGNSVAALIAARELGRAGCKVTLLSPSRRLGGHFAGLSLAGHTFDAGMVFLEFTSFNADPRAELSSYDPSRRGDVGRFFPLIESTLRTFGEWSDVPTPQMQLAGQVLPDVLIANQLSSLSALPTATREKMLRELRAITEGPRSPLHASLKTTAPEFRTLDLESVSLANHGRTFHDLVIDPFCRKVTGQDTTRFSALFHRLAWLPLYYPETLLSELDGRSQQLPETTFAYPTSGAVAHLVRRIDDELRTLSDVEVLEEKVSAFTHSGGDGPFTLRTASGATVRGDHLVWASDQDQLLALCGVAPPPALERASLVLASVLARSDELESPRSTLLLPEEERLPFRVTNQTFAAGATDALSRISCEWNATYFTGLPEALADLTRDALVELKVVRRRESVTEVRVDVFKDALVLATPGNIVRSAERGVLLQGLLPGVWRVGPAAPFGATSLNDHIVQGLKVAREIST